MEVRPSLADQIKFALGKNRLALAVYNRLSRDPRFVAGCEMANAVAVNRFGYNDHGIVHVGITAVNALRIFELLDKAAVVPTFVAEKHGSKADAQLIVLLGALLHDIGNAISRENHHIHGVTYAQPILEDALAVCYDSDKLQKVKLAVLACIFEHDESVRATSIEAGIIKPADGMDCESGRARIPYRMFGRNDIHSLSALAITRVEAVAGESRPVLIRVYMDNPAGMFQIQQVLQKKIASAGPVAQLIEVQPVLNGKPLAKIRV
ncbi:MAG: HD domain-containing protein [Candidatus Micrarchaeia archaeon]